MAIIGDEVNMSFEEVASRFGAKRKTEAVDRPDTAPGRAQSRSSPRMSPRISRHLDEMDEGEQDRISAQYGSYEARRSAVSSQEASLLTAVCEGMAVHVLLENDRLK